MDTQSIRPRGWFIKWIMRKLKVPYKIITACDVNDDTSDPLMTRYLIRQDHEAGGLYLHVFHRSDEDRCLHDHPWDFRTLILVGGYREHTPSGVKFRRPGSLLFRPAEFAHRVELVGQESISLIWVGPKRRPLWGFHTDSGWIFWKRFLREQKGCDIPD